MTLKETLEKLEEVRDSVDKWVGVTECYTAQKSLRHAMIEIASAIHDIEAMEEIQKVMKKTND